MCINAVGALHLTHPVTVVMEGVCLTQVLIKCLVVYPIFPFLQCFDNSIHTFITVSFAHYYDNDLTSFAFNFLA